MKSVSLLLFLLAVAGCQTRPDAEARGDRPLRLVTTIGMIADATKRIGAEHVEVVALMGPGVDPHLYKASQGDVEKLAHADVILYNGLNLEGKMGDIFVKMARSRATFAVSESIAHEKLREPPEFAGHYDPHIWFDVEMWREVVLYIGRLLSEQDAKHAALYTQNAQAYAKELDELHAWIKQEIHKIPPAQRLLLTAHDAFGYFGRAYGMEVKGLQGISTVSDFGLNDLNRLVQLIVERKIKAVFVESSVPRRSIEALVSGCKARGHDVAIGGSLFSDAMGAAETPEGTYIGMVRHNVNTIVEALK